MAKITMTKLGLNKNNKVEIVDFNNQKIEVKQYLPVEEKLNLISDILNQSVDTNNFYNPCRLHIYQLVNIVMAYTNITFTDKQKEDIYKLYDLLVSSGLFNEINNVIPKSETDFIFNGSDEAIKSIYAYNNSIAGILENISADYNNLDLDATKLQQKMANPDNLGFLREVMAQLG